MTNSIFSVCKYTKKLPYTKKKKDILMTKKLSHTLILLKKNSPIQKKIRTFVIETNKKSKIIT